jgi:hypothetical protein
VVGNEFQNSPVIESGVRDGAKLRVTLSLDAKPSTVYDLDVVGGSQCDAAGNVAFSRNVGSTRVTTDAGGHVVANVELDVVLPPAMIAASSTGLGGDQSTSEFSPCVETTAAVVTPTPTPTVTPTATRTPTATPTAEATPTATEVASPDPARFALPSVATPAPTAAPLPPPVVGKSVDIVPVTGTVLIKLPGSSRFVTLRAGENLPVGTSVDVTDGRIRLVSVGVDGKPQTAEFYAGRFRIAQAARGDTTTELVLEGPLPECGKRAHAAGGDKKKKKKKKKSRDLWGDGKGTFRTRGKYGSAAIRGTRWLTSDRCDGTLVDVRQGVVTVRDFTSRKTVVVRAGKHHLARAKG